MYRKQALSIIHLPKGSYILLLNSYMAKENDEGREKPHEGGRGKNKGRGEQ